MKKIGVSIMGSGMVAQVHAGALQEIDRVGLRGIWGRNSETAKKLASEYGMSVYPDYESVLADPQIEAVINCLPPGYHTEFGLLAAAAGKHLFVEKPIDISLARAEQLVGAYRSKGLALAVVFQTRFTPAAQKIKRALENGVLGRLIQGDAYVKWYRSPEYYKANAWRGTHFLTLAMGAFGIGEILSSLEEDMNTELVTTKIENVYPIDVAGSHCADAAGTEGSISNFAFVIAKVSAASLLGGAAFKICVCTF